MARFYPLLRQSDIPVCVYVHIFFICSPGDMHLDNFHVLTVTVDVQDWFFLLSALDQTTLSGDLPSSNTDMIVFLVYL